QGRNPQLKTIIIEQHTIPGGYVSGFKRKNFYFDGGAEGFSGMTQESGLAIKLKELGFEHEYYRIEPLDVYYHDETIFKLYTNKDDLFREVKTKFPEHSEGIKELFKECAKIKKVISAGQTLPEYDNLGFIDFIANFVPNDIIKDAFNLFCLWLGVGPNELPAKQGAMLIHNVFSKGVFYPKGGMQAFSNNLAAVYQNNGGQIAFSKTVQEIVVANGEAIGVKLDNGSFIQAKWIVSNADLKRTVLEYTGKQYFPDKYVKYISELKNSPTGIMAFLGVDMDLSSYPSHFQIGLSLDTLPKVGKGEFEINKLAVRIPAIVEPSLKNNGGYSIIAFIFAPYNWQNYWFTELDKVKGERYYQNKNEILDIVIDKIEQIIPGLRNKIIVKELATPLTFERYVQVTEGAWYGTPRFVQKMPDFKTPIPNLLLAGASVKGSGVMSALRSGLFAGKYILQNWKSD
ncbi:MAG: phytoene desaturase family protein, partial [Candidatus Heimdallarchaeota archaeon]